MASALSLDLHLNIAQMKIVIPMPDSQNEAWSLYIDEIIIKSNQKVEKDIYDNYDVVV